jgi:3-methyladenine DNA glycosylase/8-oxoguanine DNA glycosylase
VVVAVVGQAVQGKMFHHHQLKVVTVVWLKFQQSLAHLFITLEAVAAAAQALLRLVMVLD